MFDALCSTIHEYAGANATFCMGTVAIMRHTALLLSTQLSHYNAVDVATDVFSAAQALGRLPTAAGICAALHDAARIYAGI